MRTSTLAERVRAGRAIARKSLDVVLGRNPRRGRVASGRSPIVCLSGAQTRIGRDQAFTDIGTGADDRANSLGRGVGYGRTTSGGVGVILALYPAGDAGPARSGRRWRGLARSRIRGPVLAVVLSLWSTGCAHRAGLAEYRELEQAPPTARDRPPGSSPIQQPEAALDLPPKPELLGPQPMDLLIRRGLAENSTVQAARYNVMALRARIPQVTSLDDPVVSNTIAPIPGLALQYYLMGYNPYVFLIAQQFPWFGTLRLRGLAAEEDAKVALYELCAAQLDVVANIKKAYYDLHFNEQSERILLDSRKLAEDYLGIVKVRYETSSTGLQNVLQAEVVIRDLDRELVRVRQGIAAARADLAQQLHISPETELQTLSDAPIVQDAPEQIDRLYQLAVAVRPELRGRLAAIARDKAAVELARKRYFPNPTLGIDVMSMTKGGFMGPPGVARGTPDLMFFVAFNLPVYRKKLDASVVEAQARALADARLYDAERDSAYREVKDLFTQVQAQRSILEFYRSDILPKAEQALETSTSGYTNQTVDFPTLITAWREVLQIQLQVAQVEAELGKALASLERAVGSQINGHPIAEPAAPAAAPIPPSPPTSSGAFDRSPTNRSPGPQGPQDHGARGNVPRASQTPEMDALPPASP